MSHSALCHIRPYVVRLCVVRRTVLSFGVRWFGVMSFGLLSVYLWIGFQQNFQQWWFLSQTNCNHYALVWTIGARNLKSCTAALLKPKFSSFLALPAPGLTHQRLPTKMVSFLKPFATTLSQNHCLGQGQLHNWAKTIHCSTHRPPPGIQIKL